jgi:hypothetical protein
MLTEFLGNGKVNGEEGGRGICNCENFLENGHINLHPEPDKNT